MWQYLKWNSLEFLYFVSLNKSSIFAVCRCFWSVFRLFSFKFTCVFLCFWSTFFNFIIKYSFGQFLIHFLLFISSNCFYQEIEIKKCRNFSSVTPSNFFFLSLNKSFLLSGLAVLRSSLDPSWWIDSQFTDHQKWHYFTIDFLLLGRSSNTKKFATALFQPKK